MSFSPNLYKHELDQKAFDALSIFPKFVKLRESYIANVDEKAAIINFLSSAIRPVSYTHLDVYKRQGLEIENECVLLNTLIFYFSRFMRDN